MKKNTKLSFKTIFLVFILLFSLGEVAAAQWDVGPGQDYTTIQSAINDDKVHNGDVIRVHSGTYIGDVLVNKKLTIETATGSNVILKTKSSGFTVVKSGSGTVIKGFKILNSVNGIGINITANNCRIQNNQIKGGQTGILALDSNKTMINGNIITLATSQGIWVNGLGQIISGNTILNMVGKGNKTGILALDVGNHASQKITGNTLLNIKSTDGESTGILAIDISLFRNLAPVVITGNKIINLYGLNKTNAINLVGQAIGGSISNLNILHNTISNLNSKKSSIAINFYGLSLSLGAKSKTASNLAINNNKITNINTWGINGTSIGIQFIPEGLDNKTKARSKTENMKICNNDIVGLNSLGNNGASTAISFVGLCGGDALIFGNQISKLNADFSTIGISSVGLDYTNFASQTLIKSNKIHDFKSNHIATGIESATFGNINILYNTLYQINGDKTKNIVVISTNKASIIGNNLQGIGIGEGIAVEGKNIVIKYNRIVNYRHYIQNINLYELIEYRENVNIDEYIGEYINQHQKEIPPKYKKYIPLIKKFLISFIHRIIDGIDNFIGKNTHAQYNWYGTNSPEDSKFLKGNGNLNYYPWLVLNIKASPNTIYTGQSSTITADVYKDVAGGDHSGNSAMFFSGPRVTFSTNLGNVGSKSTTVYWVNGLATAILLANEGPGIATVKATDYQTVQTKVTILGGSTNIVSMQDTGLPINYLLLAILLVLSGLILPMKR